MKFLRPILVVIALGIAFQAGVFFQDFQQKKVESAEKKDFLHSSVLLDNVWSLLQEGYVHPEVFGEESPFEYGMIKGLVSGLDDPFSSFMTPKENDEFRESLQGEFQGIGAELTEKSGAITVVTLLKGSPAQAAGLLPEDIILEVDGEDIVGKTINEVIQKIRGPKGTSVVLKVFRTTESDSLDITITRNVITVPSVESEMKETIGYIAINQFGDDTRQAFADQFQEVMKKNPEGIIVDLRFNGGGYLDGAVHVASAFLESKTSVVQVKDRKTTMVQEAMYKPYTNTKIPVIVLINKGSASASEIFAGALQDHKRALIVGEQSFGKGTVQEVIPLQGGASLRLTIAEWLTPKGLQIHKKGITPDVIIEQKKEDREQKKDTQLEKALEILKNKEWEKLLNPTPEAEKEAVSETVTQ